MSTKFFNGFTETVEVKQAAKKYDFYHFTDVLKDARSGNAQALLYLVAANIRAISYAFKKYHSYSKDFTNNQEEENLSFFNDFYMHLIAATNRGTGPIHTFNSGIFDNQESGFLMSKFSYRMFRYAQFVLIQDIKKNKDRRDLEIQATDFNQSHWDFYPSTTPFDNLEDASVLIMDLSSEFVEYVKNHKIKALYTVLNSLLEGKNGIEIAQDFNLCKERIYQHIRMIKRLYQEYQMP
jgi:hypothetical protein